MKAITDVQTLTAAFIELAKLEQKQIKSQGKQMQQIAAIKAKHEAATAPIQAEINNIRAAIYTYATQNRDAITGGKAKSVNIGSVGIIKWRKQPDKVEVIGDTATIIAALKRRKLTRFIRVKEELDKTAILKEAAAIKTPIDGLKVIKSESENLIIETKTGK